MSRAPSLKHQQIVINIGYVLRRYLAQYPIGLVVPGPGVIFSEVDSVIPDLVYLSNERRAEIKKGDHLEGTPELAIEILSPGKANIRRDRQVKRQLYSKYQVNEYWIVDPETYQVEIFRLQEKDNNHQLVEVATLHSEDEITSPLLPDFRCLVQEFFQGL